MRIQKLTYAALEPKYPGGTLTLSGSLPQSGQILRSPWFDAETETFCTWIKVPHAPEARTRESVFHVFAADATVPEQLTYCTTVEIDGGNGLETLHLFMEIRS
jgi:hypothetical protein